MQPVQGGDNDWQNGNDFFWSSSCPELIKNRMSDIYCIKINLIGMFVAINSCPFSCSLPLCFSLRSRHSTCPQLQCKFPAVHFRLLCIISFGTHSPRVIIFTSQGQHEECAVLIWTRAAETTPREDGSTEGCCSFNIWKVLPLIYIWFMTKRTLLLCQPPTYSSSEVTVRHFLSSWSAFNDALRWMVAG